MTIQERIADDLKTAMRNKDTERKDLFRVLLSEANKIGKEASRTSETLTDEEMVKIIKKQIESAKLCNTLNEIPLMEVYLPKEMSDDDLRIIVKAVVNTTLSSNFGDLMKECKIVLDKNFDGKRVSAILKSL